MDYHKCKKEGFSLVEIVVVLGIFALLFSISTSVYNNFKSHSNLEITVNGVVEAIRMAQSNAQSGKGDSKWGMKIVTNKVVVFKGDNYTSRDVSFDESFGFSGEVVTGGVSEIVFEKLTGTTLTTGTIILTSNTENKNINVNEKGTVTY
ncbi:MAG: type II secretion system protein [archaeon]